MLSLEARWKKCPKTFFEVLERQNLKNQTIFELYTDDNKSKYSSNPKDILKSAKNQQQQQQQQKWKSTPIELPHLLLLNLFAKSLTE